MASKVPDDVRTALDDLDYPASKQDIVAHAERRGATSEALRALRGLPLADYRNDAEVVRSLPVDSAQMEGQTAHDKANQARQHARPGQAEHLRETSRSPIEEELGYNKGS